MTEIMLTGMLIKPHTNKTKCDSLFDNKQINDFLCPQLPKLRGHIGLGLSVRPVQCSAVQCSGVQSVCDARVTLSTGSGTVRARLLKFGM